MKLATVVERDIDRVGVSHQTAFSVKATAKAFKILSSGLYRDKILAIVRELSCNAYDSHKVAGKGDVPFEVHLPNALEPYFSITDHGIGLSDEDVRTVCTTYFESTKTENNDLIGALGLGMKSPFSYVDSYTLTSRFNGERRVYVLHLSEDGCPVVTQMGDTKPTNESNGVEISIPVATRGDYQEFLYRAEEVYEHFNPKPILTGGKVNYKTYPEVLRGKGWVLQKRDTSATALMGMVGYPVNLDSLWGKGGDEIGIYGLPMLIEFPMGSLDFTAGREELSYDHKVTIPNLVARAKEIAADILTEAQKRFDGCATEFEARRLYATLHASPVWRYTQNAGKIMWKGKELSSHHFSLSATDFPEVRYRTLDYKHYGRGSIRDTIFHFDKTTTAGKTLLVPADEQVKIYIDDLPRGGIGRVRHIVKTERNSISHRVFSNLTTDEIANLRKQLDGYPIHLTSDLPKPPVSVSSKKAKVRLIKSTSLQAGLVARNFANETEVDLGAGGFYVVTRGHEIDKCASRDTFGDIISNAIALGIFKATDDLHMVPVTVSTDFVESDDWVDALELIETETKKRLAASGTTDLLSQPQSIRRYNDQVTRSYGGDSILRKVYQHLPQDHAIRTLIDTANTYAASKAKAEALTSLAASFKVNVAEPKNFLDLSVLHRDIITKYPLMRILRSHYIDNNDIPHLANYISVIDNKA